MFVRLHKLYKLQVVTETYSSVIGGPVRHHHPDVPWFHDSCTELNQLPFMLCYPRQWKNDGSNSLGCVIIVMRLQYLRA